VYNYVLTTARKSFDFIIDKPALLNPRLELEDPGLWRKNILKVLLKTKEILMI
jgi:hypothetical protein